MVDYEYDIASRHTIVGLACANLGEFCRIYRLTLMEEGVWKLAADSNSISGRYWRVRNKYAPRKSLQPIVCLLILSLLTACGGDVSPTTQPVPELTEEPVGIENEAATPVPTETVAGIGGPTPISTETVVESAPVQKAVSCADIDANWGSDWLAVLDALEQLIAANRSCGEQPLLNKKYAAHFNYAVSLESGGDFNAAIAQYQAALAIDPTRVEALDALIRLDALPEPTPPMCLYTILPNPDPAPVEAPDVSLFVTAQGDQLQLNGRPFKVKGVNYYPRRASWYHFLEEADPLEMAAELDVIKQAGFNTIRVFLRYEPLFTCQPEHAIPNEAIFAKVDVLFQLARERGLKMIVTLNDLPDLTFRPLYTDWPHYDTQTVYIVRRYRNEPGVLAWDLRNEGDLDYGVRPGDNPRFSQEEVIAWLAHISQLVRENDLYHLITAGWWGDPIATSPYVDILSFHHWSEAEELEARVSDYRQRNNKPLMLQEFGYHSWAEAPQDQRDEAGQADILGRVVAVAEECGISGWVIWTAFDFVPPDGQPINYEHSFGLWRVDLMPKPALWSLPLP